MQITVLGTRGEVEPSSPYHARQSGVLVDERLLIDAGEEEYLDYEPDWIVLTHLHPDHAFFVRHGAHLITEADVFVPEATPLVQGGKVMEAEKTFRLDGYEVTPLPTHHSKHVDSMALLVANEGKRFLYTSDLIWLNKEYHRHLEGLDLLIAEGSFLRKGGMVRRDKETGAIYGHKGVPDLIRLFQPFTKRIVIVHLGSWFYKEGAKASRKAIRALGRKQGLDAAIGYDGMEIAL
jgi:glyoxylase-like metal-dependent hydrolase (beta-lactamase superfamily II)